MTKRTRLDLQDHLHRGKKRNWTKKTKQTRILFPPITAYDGIKKQKKKRNSNHALVPLCVSLWPIRNRACMGILG